MALTTNPARHLSYRGDIDGLRAVAVLLVVCNHIGLGHFPGGFIGVDVFFVISGYLIGANILREMDAGKFSIGRFYERRVRRIMPALLVMLLAVSWMVYKFNYPLERLSFAQTTIATLFSYSNVLFSRQLGYFSPTVRSNPYLHTWSLGVEEQFYFAFPLLLWVVTRVARRHLRLLLWCLIIPLFLVACYWTKQDSVAAFYLSPLRAWELLLGVLPAAAALPSLPRASMRSVASGAGLLMILAAGIFYDEAMLFPGWSASLPCLGALLVIWAGEFGDSPIGRALAWTPLRSIGLISYSLYLWHWPIQVYQISENILVPDRYPAWVARLAVLCASLAAGAFSWRFIEQPFRTGIFRRSKPWLFGITALLFAVAYLFNSRMTNGNGMPVSFLPQTRAQQDVEKVMPTPKEIPFDTCLIEPGALPMMKPADCLADDTTRPHVLLLGDSHAGSLFWGLKNAFPEFNISLFAVTRCTPTLVGRNPSCQVYSDALFKTYLPTLKIDSVILLSRWIDWDADAHMADTVQWFKNRGIRLVIVGPSFEFDRPLPRLLQLAEREHDAGVPARHRVASVRELDRHMETLARQQWHVPYISMYDDLCRPDYVKGGPEAFGCPLLAAPGVPILWDTDHLSPTGSIFFANIIRSRQEFPIGHSPNSGK